MALNTREIKGRLRSIKNTQKITHTMELVAAAKMRRAVTGAINSRTYSTLAWDLVQRLRQAVQFNDDDPRQFWFDQSTSITKQPHTTVLVFTSNRGLCGAFNNNVIKQTVKFLKTVPTEAVTIVCVGKKGAGTLSTLGYTVHQAYAKADSARNDESIQELAEYVYEEFTQQRTHRVVVAYTDYQSSISQTAVIRQLYPLTSQNTISQAVDNADAAKPKITPPTKHAVYKYEPSAEAVLEYIVPRIAEVQLYQALLESNASEHSARMLAMKSATDAAGDMSDELVLAFNRARQAAITKEIAEISAGSAALS
ncbi:MAG: ATP synthase F1 subunit gamma [Candidatus Kerfeldbacteria bacterium]|nr:ATP synthase F1 subunit gamma [Candidatus Kerfeldbacteria bacterium]